MIDIPRDEIASARLYGAAKGPLLSLDKKRQR
jgi:hypothetical protein